MQKPKNILLNADQKVTKTILRNYSNEVNCTQAYNF